MPYTSSTVNKSEKRVIFRRFGWVVIFLVGVSLLLVSHYSPSFATWYATYIFPIFPHTLGRLLGLVPFSVFEISVILIGLRFIFGVMLMIINLCSSPGRIKIMAGIRRPPVKLFYIPALIFLMFVLTTGINYGRESFARYVGINVQPSNEDELIQLYLMLVDRAEQISSQIKTDENGYFVLRTDGLYSYARLSMHNLNNLYGGLGTFFPQAKAPIFSQVLSHLNIGGFFSPWTMEAHYNGVMPSQSIPFVINHELAHAAGHMREDEANFIAYLAASNSQNVDFNYSAVYVALGYILNALQTLDREQFESLRLLLPLQLKRDFDAAGRYWALFKGRAGEIASRANDAYLRLNQQSDGVQSYGRMVDLLLAYYRRLIFLELN